MPASSSVNQAASKRGQEPAPRCGGSRLRETMWCSSTFSGEPRQTPGLTCQETRSRSRCDSAHSPPRKQNFTSSRPHPLGSPVGQQLIRPMQEMFFDDLVEYEPGLFMRNDRGIAQLRSGKDLQFSPGTMDHGLAMRKAASLCKMINLKKRIKDAESTKGQVHPPQCHPPHSPLLVSPPPIRTLLRPPPCPPRATSTCKITHASPARLLDLACASPSDRRRATTARLVKCGLCQHQPGER